jgi:hypothetical protein
MNGGNGNDHSLVAKGRYTWHDMVVAYQ